MNGGSGSNGVGTFFVDYFRGTAGSGAGYSAGTFTGIPLQGGSGSDAAVDFSVTGLEVAEKISKSLAKQAMVISVDGELKDLEHLIEKDCSVKFYI